MPDADTTCDDRSDPREPGAPGAPPADRPRGAASPSDGEAVWRADDERVVSDLTDPSGDAPYGPESDTSRPTTDRPEHVERGAPARDATGMSTADPTAATGRGAGGRGDG